MADLVKVRNTQPRVLSMVFGKLPGERVGGAVRLVPGENPVSTGLAARALGNARFALGQRKGWVVVTMTAALTAHLEATRTPAERTAKDAARNEAQRLGDKQDDAEGGVVDLAAFRAMAAKAAIEHVRSSNDVDQLEAFLGAEERVSVTKVLLARLRELEGAPQAGPESGTSPKS